MNALQLFIKYAPNKTFAAILASALSGGLYAFLIPILMTALTVDYSNVSPLDKIVEFFGIEVAHSEFALLFLVLVLMILVLKTVSEIVLANISLNIRFQLRKDLYQQILSSPISSLERVGSARLIQSLGTDISAIIKGAELFPAIMTNSITLMGMLAYLVYLDQQIFIYIIQIIFIGVITFQIPVYWASKRFAKAREHMDVLQEGFNGLISGAKELKLSSQKQDVYLQEVLYAQEQTIKANESKGITIYSLADNWASLLCFFAIGGLSFIFTNYHQISNAELIGGIMVLLYVTGPISMLLNFIPELARTRISLNKIDDIYQKLDNEDIIVGPTAFGDWDIITFEKIGFKHQAVNEGEREFAIGPVSFSIKKGEITLIAGGNGSGKSTLSKVISQHYLPSEGQIYCDDTLISSENIHGFRQQIGCIYSDYYLFQRILVADNLELIEHYLEVFGLSKKVTIKDGHFSTLKLSDGQRRRLALVVAIAEDKALYIFDEWAADQDPQFKEVFYCEILPFLKQKNKAVVLISHDDRYFYVADQLLVMESGQLVLEPVINNEKALLIKSLVPNF